MANGSSSSRNAGGGELRGDSELKVRLRCRTCLSFEGMAGFSIIVEVDAYGDEDPERERIFDTIVVGLTGREASGEGAT